jgi:GntR family transcriptional regulator
VKKSKVPIELDPRSDLPLWVQLRKRLVHLINIGHYRPGDQLPTVRGLASGLSINYNTVNKAYLSMIHDGFITSTQGRGVFVSASEASDEEQMLEADALMRDFIEACRDLGLTTWDIRKLLMRQLRQLETQRPLEGDEEAESGAELTIGQGDKGVSTAGQESRTTARSAGTKPDEETTGSRARGA